MDALFEKLDRLSSPLGSLLDAALNRLVPHATASALVCGSFYLCYVTCGAICGAAGSGTRLIIAHYSTSSACTHITGTCSEGCHCY
jgi:hypothetical protein